MFSYKRSKIIILSSVLSTSLLAKPADWKITFGADTTSLSNYSKVAPDPLTNPTNDSMEVSLGTGQERDASFQSYRLSLSPTFLINDSATVKAEISTGFSRSSILGKDGKRVQSTEDAGNNLYHYSTSAGNSALSLSQMWLELYSETATYLIGRHKSHWGLGAMVNEGKNPWDRHFSMRDGITMKVKIGNFHIDPFLGQVSSSNTLVSSHQVTEWGGALLYDNHEKELAFGIYYSNRKGGSNDNSIKSTLSGTTLTQGKTATELVDLFWSQRFHQLKFGIEIPLLKGNLGHIYSASESANYNASAVLFQTAFQYNKIWSYSLDAGTVSGDSGSANSFQATYLHPNFKIAHILFSYNPQGITDSSTSGVYDSSITNTSFLKVGTRYESEKWDVSTGVVYALANETASKGAAFLNHEKNKHVTYANVNQKKDYGVELDFDFRYSWNNDITLGGAFAYLFTGDYYAFTNHALENKTKNPTLIKFDVICNF